MLAAAALGYSLAPARPAPSAHAARAAVLMVDTNTNVAQTEDTSREKVMIRWAHRAAPPDYSPLCAVNPETWCLPAVRVYTPWPAHAHTVRPQAVHARRRSRV